MGYEDIKKISAENIEKFYDKWISAIAKEYSKSELISHLKKHFQELENADTNLVTWNASLANLSNVLSIVLGKEKDYHEKCKRLLRHYKKDPQKNTPPPSLGKIGFSTGALCKTNFSLEKIIDSFIKVGTNAVELLFAYPKELLDFEPNQNFIDKLKTFSWLSIHSPWKYSNYENELETVIIKLCDLHSKLPVNGIIVHPYVNINDGSRLKTNFDILEKTELPILIENMNNLNKYGSHPRELISIKDNYSFDFVFDTNHAYVIDSTMKLGKEILNVFGNRLKEIHVSGFQNGKHCPIYLNPDKGITEILKQEKGIPKISEGLITKNLKELKSELSYLINLEI